MRNLLLLLCASLVVNLNFSSSVKAQAFEQGASVASVGYGIPNLPKVLFRTFTFGSTDYTVGGLGPFSLKYEYGITDKLGIGASLNLASAKLNYDDGTDIETLKYSTFNALIRVNWHFLDHDRIDFYSGAGIGYNLNRFGAESTDPDYDATEAVEELNTFFNIFPIGYEGTVGMRILFTDNIGAYMEVGYSKAIIQGGIVGRF